MSFAGLRFQPVVLEQLGYVYSQPRGINDFGTVVGSVQNTLNSDPFNTRATIWNAHSGAGSLLGGPAGYLGSNAYDINNNDVTVGYVSNGSYSARAMRYSNGSFDLPPLLFSGMLLSINDAGQAVGANFAQPILIQGQTVTDLNGSSTTNEGPTSISSNGLIVGYRFADTAGKEFALRFAPGQLPVRLEVTSYSSYASGVNSKNTIVGHVTIPNTPIAGAIPVVFQAGSYSMLPGGFNGIEGKSAIALAINDQGWTVGAEGMSSASMYDTIGALWKDGEYYQVTSMLPAAYTGLLQITRINAINNRGQLVAVARFDQDGDPNTFGWTNASVRLDPIRSPGDTNYDDVVDFTDLLTLAQHYGESGNGNVFWETGDFNFDWNVNYDDLLTIAQHYSSAAAFESDWKLAQSIVPEPGAFAAFSALTLVRRRRAI